MGAQEKITLSVIKADVGGYVGHSGSHPDMLALAESLVKAAVERGFLVAVAGGLEKTEAIRACLKGRYFNVLITDAYVAEALGQG